MDRLARFLPLRLVVPLVGVALAGLPWLMLRNGASVSAGRAPFAQSTSSRLISATQRGGTPKPSARLAICDVASRPPLVMQTATGNAAQPLVAASGPDLLASRSQSGMSKVPVTVKPEPSEANILSPMAPSPPSVAVAEPRAEPKGEPRLVDSLPPPPMDIQEPFLPAGPPRPEPSAPRETVRGLPPVVGGQPPRTPPPLPRPLPPRFASTPLPVAPPAARSGEMENIAKQADRQIRHGFELANREAYFAARAEFTAALRLLAQGLDADDRTTVHSRALSVGMTALKEAQDFVPTGTKMEAELDLAALVGSHRTPVLKSVPAGELRPMPAVRSYLTFAQEQLTVAAGREVAGSMALCALGKLHSALAKQRSLEVQSPESKAIVFFQAALLVYPNNYMASNDLGVLLAHCGNHPDARRALEHSVLVNAGVENLNNLAVVYDQLGEQQLAAQTRQKVEWVRRALAAQSKNPQGSAGGLVQWVDPPALAQFGTASSNASQRR